ncbi:UDP-N-acetylmuramoyl-L-alanine--D-glutamate ligase [Chelatococcus sambhunathii]|uniref:UDP-N-acetylmuramoylalanine--D-glutamate ligase n=1 Tax=Chelatococcus sambhunathii TaxID=363953 RepID=A0ABU1DHU2_9HYPH|nr:UDP-N-acetylmuramoyl-L-alanine--D-glutamate ligase [Chelatococcus sambhunathii]MDR4307657.1 UDP-N-acetylmuramoyl-L-alanine--D-glutamate ligase [Chelatococcus sambhunathii]
MTPATSFRGRRVAVFGLGGSGLATVRSLVAGGAEATAFDDSEASVAKAKSEGLPVGDLREGDFARFHSLVLAPGVPLTHPKPHWSVELAKAAGVEIIGDIEIFCRERRAVAPGADFVAITGTNGKSTTTALTAHVLREAGRDVQMGGNIGVAILELEPPSNARVHVVECSSYQIDLAPSLDPTVGVMLNLSEDHLERHGTMENYAAIKERLVARSGTAVIGRDDEISVSMAARLKAAGVNVVEISEADSIDLSAARALRGAHNAQNASAVRAVARALGVDDATIEKGFSTFPGLAHRMEEIPTSDGITWINDSKATNADSAEKALASFDKVFWILGGKPKTGGIEALVPFFPRVLRAYLIGEAAEAFSRTLAAHDVPWAILGTIERAVEAASADAKGAIDGAPVVLFSPACASFDQYRNFEQRGEAFRKAVQAVTGG